MHPAASHVQSKLLCQSDEARAWLLRATRLVLRRAPDGAVREEHWSSIQPTLIHVWEEARREQRASARVWKSHSRRGSSRAARTRRRRSSSRAETDRATAPCIPAGRERRGDD